MLINVRGRVESDPMGIPAPARMATAAPESFEAMLQQAQQEQVAPQQQQAPVEAPPVEEPAPVVDEAAEAPPEGDPTADAVSSDQTTDATPVPVTQVAGNNVANVLERGEPVRQETAGKGTDSPRTSTDAAESLLAAVMQRGAQATPTPLVAVTSPGVQAIGATKATEAPVRGIEGLAAKSGAPARATAVAGGYRTNAKVSAELIDNARDSVFKQILLKLTDGGGEMRVRLQPPDFGELDLHMTVERGNQLSLWIGAERPEMATMLHDNLDELRSALKAAGLEVTDAQVGTRDGNSDRRGTRGEHEHGDARDTARDADTARNRFGGYVTADGLDFWA